MKKTLLVLLSALLLAATASAEVRGTYLETRNAEIYASHCFANAEAGILGDLAVMAWKVESGSVELEPSRPTVVPSGEVHSTL